MGTGTFQNIDCTDPKKLFEKAVQKPEEFIHTVWIKIFGDSSVKFTKASESFEDLWKPMDFVYDPIGNVQLWSIYCQFLTLGGASESYLKHLLTLVS